MKRLIPKYYECDRSLYFSICGQAVSATAVLEDTASDTILYIFDVPICKRRYHNVKEGFVKYEDSEIRQYLIGRSRDMPEPLKSKLIPFENGDALRLLRFSEMSYMHYTDYLKNRPNTFRWVVEPDSISYLGFVSENGRHDICNNTCRTYIFPVFQINKSDAVFFSQRWSITSDDIVEKIQNIIEDENKRYIKLMNNGLKDANDQFSKGNHIRAFYNILEFSKYKAASEALESINNKIHIILSTPAK